MKFEFTGRHIEVTPALRAHVKEQFGRARHLLDGKPVKAHVIIEVEKGRHRSEIVLKWHDKTLTAHTAMSDMYQSLSKTVEKLEKQVLKSKNKLIDKHQKGKKAGTIRISEAKTSKRGPKIVAHKAYRVKPLSPEDAALLLVEEANDFLLFTNSETKKLSLIYKRNDGDYGLITP